VTGHSQDIARGNQANMVMTGHLCGPKRGVTEQDGHDWSLCPPKRGATEWIFSIFVKFFMNLLLMIGF
jgi:hypothetical protein